MNLQPGSSIDMEPIVILIRPRPNLMDKGLWRGLDAPKSGSFSA